MKSLMDTLKDIMGLGWDFTDRRRLLRLPCELNVQIHRGHELLLGQLKDLSISGMQLMVFGPINTGDGIRVISKNIHLRAEYDSVGCKVRWRQVYGNNHLVGVAFTDVEDIMARSWVFFELKRLGLEASTAGQKRAGLRVVCKQKATLLVGDQETEVELRDLGVTGARIQTSRSLEPEARVSLKLGPVEKLPAITLGGTVALIREDGHFGIEFEEQALAEVRAVQRYLEYFFANG